MELAIHTRLELAVAIMGEVGPGNATRIWVRLLFAQLDHESNEGTEEDTRRDDEKWLHDDLNG
jgi:hypothetical protein